MGRLQKETRGLNRDQLRSFTEEVLAEMARLMDEPRINSRAAVNLLLGTAAQESQFGHCLVEYSGGPGRGLNQITHKPNFYYLCAKYGDQIPYIAGKPFEQCKWDLKLSIIIARLWYWEDRDPLPDADDVEAMGVYWDQKFNRNPNAGTPAEFVANYRRYVLGEPVKS